jgi:hypothetical protein
MAIEHHDSAPVASTRITVNLNAKSTKALDRCAEIEQDSKTVVVNRALQIYEWILEEKIKGNQLAILDANGGTLHVVKIF